MSRARIARSARVRRYGALSLVAALVWGASLGVTVDGPQAEAATTASSAVTLTGKGDFAGLKVTIPQTKDLINQVVPITWTGGHETEPSVGSFSTHYLQIMQCWANASSGPTREQCQFGAYSDDQRGGKQSKLRQLVGDEYVDPLEKTSTFSVPFTSFDGDTVPGDKLGEKFDQQTTNEVPYAPTRADGTGQEYFNIQTVQEAPGLGCGKPVTVKGRTTGRSCWLVVVPRGDKEVDGTTRSGAPNDAGRLQSSPLSASNWKHRMQVKLDFLPTGDSCPFAKERRTVGHEFVAEAILRWQPTLCANGGAVYGFSQVADDLARRKLKTEDPGLVFLTEPLKAADNPDRLKVTYAPVALSALSIGFVIDSQSPGGAAPEIKKRDGTRLTSMNLTPRLVAKLLTGTYQRSVNESAPSVAGNKKHMLEDPEFLAINKSWEGLSPSLHDVFLPVGRSDASNQLWSWLLSDPEAKAFLEGAPDPSGMKVNPNFKQLDLPRYDYPKPDPFCIPHEDPRPDECMLDLHPYSADMHDGARSIAVGDTQLKYWDGTKTPPAYSKIPRSNPGSRIGMALIDAPAAARYTVVTAAIRNAAGTFVKPTNASLLAVAAEMKPSSVSTVLAPAPGAKAKNAYPLTTVSYAATVPSALDDEARTDYAAFLDYAAGKGQVSGQLAGNLPAGYAPLPTAMRNQTKAAAKALLAGRALTGPEDDGSGNSPDDDGATAPDSGGAAPVGAVDGAVPPVAASVPASGVVGGPEAVVVASRTPVDAAGLIRWVPFVALTLGLFAAVAGPVLLHLGRRRVAPAGSVA